ncbi:sensor histidine kinase [Azospirillum doebereinerae]|uniref:histidine kinase n=1 Tax=Azospirillum doebereinerae TaxID=92933 RepID=A0A3S0V5T7_9PROT|nr:histidine kinase N-terminal 7TM domain-containing protein [Azospirillum doebereinerae]MCG5240688.1 ATP-binding protein [Azospirillum doebereinerae]RUQ69285.1 PAS domain-containing protein [Azospirillum doebereinerae]
MLTLPAVLLLGTVLITLLLARQSWRLPPFPGRVNFLAMQLSASWWATAAAAETLALSPTTKLFWAKMAWTGIVGAPSFWFLFIWSYIHGEVSARWRQVPMVMGLVTWGMAMTNDWHRLLYASAQPIGGEPGAALSYVHGPWFLAVTIYLYTFMVLSFAVTASGIGRAAPAHRAHYVGFLLAVAVPWVANIGYVTSNVVLFDIDPTPFSFLITGIVFYWLIARRRLFELLPIARGALLDAVPDPVLVLDGDGTVVQANPAAESLVTSPGRLIGRRLDGVPEIGPVLVPQALAEPSDGPAPRLVQVGNGPQAREFEVTRVPLSYDGRSVGQLLLLRDVTLRRRIEARLHDTVRTLDTARQEAETLLAAEQEAKRALNSFLSMAAHEFKTPLAIIDGSAQMLLLDAEAKAPAMIPRLEKIRRAVRRQVGILETCLADDRLSDPSLTLRRDDIDLPALLRGAASAQADGATDRHLELELEDCPPRLSGDASLLELCVHNLLNNGLKYSRPGGRVALRVWSETGEPRPMVRLSVTDQGIGIPPEEVERVFDRFYRASNVRGAAGSGVGLNMVRRIAILHGGGVQVESRLGEGSRFTLSLPLGTEPRAAVMAVSHSG